MPTDEEIENALRCPETPACPPSDPNMARVSRFFGYCAMKGYDLLHLQLIEEATRAALLGDGETRQRKHRLAILAQERSFDEMRLINGINRDSIDLEKLHPNERILTRVPQLVIDLARETIIWDGHCFHAAPQIVFIVAVLALRAREAIGAAQLSVYCMGLGYRPKRQDETFDRKLVLHRIREAFKENLKDRLCPMPDFDRIFRPAYADGLLMEIDRDQARVFAT